MGMDFRIFKSERPRPTRNASEEKMTDWENTLEQVYYARKFWELWDIAKTKLGAECGEYVELTKDCAEELRNAAAVTRDYFDGFTTVPDLCEICNTYDEDREFGYHFYVECDW